MLGAEARHSGRLDHLPEVLLSELAGLVVLLASLGALGLAAGFVGCCLGIRSPLELALATYVLAWSWLVLVALALSPARMLTREGLLAGVAVGLAAALALWARCARPRPPPLRPSLRAARAALRLPAVAVLAVGVTLGAVYSIALGLLTPANDGDALAYHLARAAFWHQENGLGYVGDAVDVRLNGNPPNAEIGQLATMLLSGSDRYVALPQLAAYAALALCVAALARRLGLDVPEALFAALAFATLPVVAVQASSALNDLVVASFLAIAAVFALRPGRISLVLLALALGLALGTKLTAVLALFTLAVVVALGRPRQAWLGLAAAGLAGTALGSTWYVVNLAETGALDGGLAQAFDQRVDFAVSAVVVNVLRFGLDLVDMSGAAHPHDLLFVAAGAVLAVLGLVRRRLSLVVAGALAAVPFVAEQIVDAAQRVVFKAWLALGEPKSPPFDDPWGLNIDADPVDSWYGPLGPILLVAGTVAAVVLWRRKVLPRMAFGFALAPWLLLASIALVIVWDPWRGRFLVFGFVLAAATWGVLLRSRVLASATAGIGTIALALALANYQGKPSGLGDLWMSGDPPPPGVHTVWNDERWAVQSWLRPGDEREDRLLRFLEERIPEDTHVAVALRVNDFLSPYFSERLSRRVSLVPPESPEVPEDAEWLVLAPAALARRCDDAWRPELALDSGWRVERRIAADDCPELA